MNQTTVHQIFVYGSLRSGFNAPAYEYISRYFQLVAPAKVRGLLFDMGEYPAAVPTQQDHFLLGELYAIKQEEEFGWALDQLDEYEGINESPEDSPVSFKRELVEVITESGNTIAWIYWFSGSIADKPLIASGDVLEYLHQQQQKK
ncbi:MAG: hypothetical protein CFE25_03935 [Chitinophagaceae bacterium BSSC1]|nr:MAG: hypothetical protein CFE25_03935 [Chitinophagaceae bacterium BSSC1]